MINLILSILCSSLIFILFRIFPKFRVNNSIAITFNYLVAFMMGLFLT
ncbi:MAG: EamA/RhaT family transporter, partial [Bacteroidetes bacterium]